MARELVAVAARTPELREYVVPPVGAGQVRVVSELGAVRPVRPVTVLAVLVTPPVAARVVEASVAALGI